MVAVCSLAAALVQAALPLSKPPSPISEPGRAQPEDTNNPTWGSFKKKKKNLQGQGELVKSQVPKEKPSLSALSLHQEAERRPPLPSNEAGEG